MHAPLLSCIHVHRLRHLVGKVRAGVRVRVRVDKGEAEEEGEVATPQL